jgi:signal transduction histidine kinase
VEPAQSDGYVRRRLASIADGVDLPSFANTDQSESHVRGRDLLRAGAVGDEFLRGLVRHVALAFDAKFAFVAEATDPNGQHVEVLSGWYDGDWLDEPFDYDTRGKPCGLVVENAVVAFPEELTKRFPDAKPAIEMGLESYLAVCLRASDGTHLGHMGVMDAGPMEAAEDDVAAMRIFASRTAAELERRSQAAALRRSRARVIEAADAERRRVGRDLHDGAQQRLMAVGNLLKVAQRNVGEDQEVAGLLRLAHDELGEANAELRDLARGLHPVALSERGLPSALESLAAACDVPVTLEVRVDELPEPVELAAYFIVSESLTNARKYAAANEVRIRVVGEEGTLVVEIVDDGRGGADAAAGTGLCGLADRVDGLGGRFEVHSPPGEGTRISAWLPLHGDG